MSRSRIENRCVLLGVGLACLCLGCNSASVPGQSNGKAPVSISAETSTSADEVKLSDFDLLDGDVATFGAGCFWCVEAIFERLEGVKDVESGYAGDEDTDKADYAEVCRITFDSGKISYDELLEVFWKTHDPTTLNRQGHDRGIKYRSAIFYHNEQQQELAEESKRKLTVSGAWNDPIVTEISPLAGYYKAEGWHQDYFSLKPEKGYCRAIVAPKVEKFEQAFREKLKEQPQQ
jgi:peptide-methionine (S)-S-oxide reductase